MSLDFYLKRRKDVEVYWGNYTHNVTPMWRLAGIYNALYNSQGKKAYQILPALKRGRNKMEKEPTKFCNLNPQNGWGDCTSAFKFLEEIIKACEENPNGKIRISK